MFRWELGYLPRFANALTREMEDASEVDLMDVDGRIEEVWGADGPHLRIRSRFG